MKRKILWLRITFWWGIIADAFEVVRMTFPRLFLATTGSILPPETGFRFGLLYGAPVMLAGRFCCSGPIGNRWSARAFCSP